MTTVISDNQSLQKENLKFRDLLGIKAADSLQLVRFVKRGFSFKTLEQIRRKTGLPMEQLATSIGISPRTLKRRKKEKRLSPNESDRLVSVSRLIALSVRLFEGDRAKAFDWFSKPNRALGNFSPLEIAETETGAREVENLIGRLEYGVFS